jgi:hypothetical protein
MRSVRIVGLWMVLLSASWALGIFGTFWGGLCTVGDEPIQASCAGLAAHWGPALHALYWYSVVLAPLSFVLGCGLFLIGALTWSGED